MENSKENRMSITSQQSSQFSFELKTEDINTSVSARRSPYPTINSPAATSFNESKSSLISPVKRAMSPAQRFHQVNSSVSSAPQTATIIAASPTRISRSQSPSIVSVKQHTSPNSGQLSRMEMLVLENEELRNLLLNKDQIIQSLEQQVSLLKQRLELISPNKEPEIESDEENTAELPPRSANRIRTVAPIDNDENEDNTFDEDTTIKEEENPFDLSVPKQPVNSTPISSNSNIDWNAAVQALSMSPEENLKLKTPDFEPSDYFNREKSINTVPPTPPRRPQPEVPLNKPIYTPNVNQSPEKYPNSVYTSTPSSTFVASPSTNTFTPKDDLPLLIQPNQLNTISPEIISTLSPNIKKKDTDYNIIIGLFDRSSNKEIWRIKKSLSKIKDLNDEIGRILLDSEFGHNHLLIIPDKSNFLTNTPLKVDQRRIELNNYFKNLFQVQLNHLSSNKGSQLQYIIARFISGDIVNLLDESNLNVLKNGWLIMKKFKGLKYQWKVKYCELDIDSGVFKIEGGELINLQNAQIGRQQESNNNNLDDEKAYRHAFIIMEPKNNKKNGFNKHIFCAETDNERDIWVNFLIQTVDEFNNDDNKEINESEENENSLISIEYNDTTVMKSPNSQKINDEKESKKLKKRSFFPFSKKQVASEFENYKQEEISNIEKSLELMNILNDNNNKEINYNKIFGNKIEEIFKLSNEEIFNVQVPSILSQCIKYLIKYDAIYEEGIFRLNGSSSLIKKLKNQYDEELSINFESFEIKPDINSIAGLLKLWFREISGDQILSNEIIFRLEKNELNNWKDIVILIPEVNKSILIAILKFLNMIIENQEYNKMNLKNLTIVFSPTLNISNDILTRLIINSEYLFNGGELRAFVKDVNISNF